MFQSWSSYVSVIAQSQFIHGSVLIQSWVSHSSVTFHISVVVQSYFSYVDVFFHPFGIFYKFLCSSCSFCHFSLVRKSANLAKFYTCATNNDVVKCTWHFSALFVSVHIPSVCAFTWVFQYMVLLCPCKHVIIDSLDALCQQFHSCRLKKTVRSNVSYERVQNQNNVMHLVSWMIFWHPSFWSSNHA